MIWDWWLKDQWNQPSRTDHYLMRLMQMQSGKGVSLDNLKIRFVPKEPDNREPWQPKKMSKEEMEQRTRLFKQQLFRLTKYQPKPGEL
jgi:hypothetical protein